MKVLRGSQRARRGTEAPCRPRVRCVLPVAALAVAACSILDPVPPPAQVTVFGGGKAAKAAAVAASGPERSDKAPACESGTRGPACFAGELGNAVDEADERRIVLLSRARDVSNGNAAFNAIQFPFGAAALYEKLRGAPNHNFLLPAAIAAGAYGFVNSGVVDRERHYLREAFELHCAIVRAGRYLYLDDEINTPAEQASSGGPPSLLQLISRLDGGLSAFDKKRIANSFDLKGRAGSGVPSDARARRVAEASGRGGGTAGNNKTQEVQERWSLQAATASALRERLIKLRRTINDAGASFRREVADIAQQAQGTLSERVPLPRSPKQTAEDLKADLVAQSGAAGVSALDPVLPRALQAGLSDTSLLNAKAFAETEGLALKVAYAAANDWAIAHDERVQASAAETIRLNCSQRLAPEPPRPVASQPAGGKPSTDNTAGSSGNSGGGGTSPLPDSK